MVGVKMAMDSRKMTLEAARQWTGKSGEPSCICR